MSNFAGFERPEQDWYKMPYDIWQLRLSPHQHILLSYIMRHTRGPYEYDIAKHITLDEFENGRKFRDGSRMDHGVGMSRPTIIKHLASLEKLGYIAVETAKTDPARVKKFYTLVMGFGEEE